jgi:hypothetical protein
LNRRPTPNCFIVRDANRQQLAYVYYENEPGRRSAAKLLSKDEARRIAANIAKLPELRKDLVDTPGSQPKLVTTAWASKDANFGVATRHWYNSH